MNCIFLQCVVMLPSEVVAGLTFLQGEQLGLAGIQGSLYLIE